MDNNVHMPALINASKTNFGLMIFPDAPHFLPVFHIRKRWHRAVKYLLNQEPPADYE